MSDLPKTLYIILNHNAGGVSTIYYEELKHYQEQDNFDLLLIDNGSRIPERSIHTTHQFKKNVYFNGAIQWAFKYMLDHPLMIKMFAKLGREMGEVALGSVATEGEKENLMEQANSYREKRMDAYAKGNHAEARKWDEKERIVLDKLHGGGPIVGTDTRTS